MGRSIRRRLVGSYVLTTLLSVAVMGGLGLSLVAQIGRLRERQELSRSASAIAEQAVPWIDSAPASPMLGELARGAAFLLDARVRIFDAESSLLAEAGADSGELRLLWLAGDELDSEAFSGGGAARPPSIPWVGAGADSTSAEARREDRMAVEGGEESAGPSAEPWVFALRRGRDGELAGNVHIELVRDGRLAHSITRTLMVSNAEPGLDAIANDELVRVTESRDEGMTVGPVDILHTEVVRRDHALERVAGLLAGRPASEETARSDSVIRASIGAVGAPLGYVEISQAPDGLGPSLSSTGRAFGLAAMGATLLAALVGVRMSRGLSQPLADLDAAAGRMGEGDLAARAEVTTQDEIGRLASRFNDMAGRLERSFAEIEAERDALRRFVADASHELRTPITALHNYNSLLLGEAVDDPAERQDFLSEQARQIDRLAWITANLLDLSRLDAGLVDLDLETCRPEDLLRSTAEAYRAAFDGAGTRLELELGPDLPDLIADPERLRIALGNLVENALKFAARGGPVILRVVETSAGEAGRLEAGLRFEIEDAGPGIDPAERERVFERFHRGRDTADLPGSGLGLAIVRGIARRHGGEAWLDAGRSEGARACLWLPMGAPPAD